MIVEYDEKGKIYTNVIIKDKILCRILTEKNLIKGFVHVQKNDRLSDEINRDESFLSVTDAEIFSHEGDILFTTEFIIINRAHIVWLTPIEELQTRAGKAG